MSVPGSYAGPQGVYLAEALSDEQAQSGAELTMQLLAVRAPLHTYQSTDRETADPCMMISEELADKINKHKLAHIE
jgi:hypothetical protein